MSIKAEMSVEILSKVIRCDYDSLKGSFLEHHADNWGNPDIPTPLELERSIKSEVYSWLSDLGIEVTFKTNYPQQSKGETT